MTLLFACLVVAIWSNAAETSEESKPAVEELVVEGDPRDVPTRSNIGSLTTVDSPAIELIRPQHPHELFARVPGVWIVQNSGQEHLVGFRSAVRTGPGACGSYVLLEDNIPIRPIGMCNVNGLFELNLEQADRIEVLRGPASTIYGGNALRGVINSRPFIGDPTRTLSLELGAHQYRQLRVTWDSDIVQSKLLVTDTNEFRASTGSTQQKVNLGWTSNFGAWEANHSLSIITLKQDTGGYVLGYQAYKDKAKRNTNPNPEAYRHAEAIRIYSQLHNTSQFYIYPYARMSRMNFLQHFLPGQPQEENKQTSFGVILLQGVRRDSMKINLGAHLDWMSASLVQQQHKPTVGSIFLRETRPMGTHYNFEVVGVTIAAFQSATVNWRDHHELEESIRVEHTRYEYDNLHLDGNTRDDGSSCGFGGCLYTRPSDRADDFTNVAAQLGYKFLPTHRTQYWIMTSIGYRPPQITELYRLQSGQTNAHLQSEKTHAVEIGWRKSWLKFESTIVVFHTVQTNLIFRDAHGLNVSDGATEVRGIEVDLQWQLNDSNEISVAGSHSGNKYKFTRDVARGETIMAGNKVDTAPRVLAHARWTTSLGGTGSSEIEINRIGSHYLNAANTAKYGGHNVVNVRMKFKLTRGWSLYGRILNVFDGYYANRADFAFGNYRYFPADLRRIFVGIQRTFT